MKNIWERLKEIFVPDPTGQMRRLVGRPQGPGLGGSATIPIYEQSSDFRWLEGGSPVVILERAERREGDTTVPVFRVLHQSGIFWVHERYVTKDGDYEDFYDL
jgi:hypothetical protein